MLVKVKTSVFFNFPAIGSQLKGDLDSEVWRLKLQFYALCCNYKKTELERHYRFGNVLSKHRLLNGARARTLYLYFSRVSEQ